MIQPQLPQVLNFNPSVPGPFLTPQINQLNPAQLPPLRQEQPVNRLGPNNAIPAQNPAQVHITRDEQLCLTCECNICSAELEIVIVTFCL